MLLAARAELLIRRAVTSRSHIVTIIRATGVRVRGQAGRGRAAKALTRTRAELEEHEMITRTRSQADRRASILSLTEAGRQALTEDLSQRASWLADESR